MTTVFHKGELALQTESGVQERMHKLGNVFIRDHIIDQHKEFFENLPYVFVALQDNDGRPWMSIMQGRPGFINSPDETTLNLSGEVAGAVLLNLQTQENKPIGLVGLDLSNRRRNRLNGNLKKSVNHGILSIAVGHSFGNCPKYIQLRNFEFNGNADQPDHGGNNSVDFFTKFDKSDSDLIERSDTLFIASAEKGGGNLDASHRGGKPGFVRVDSESKLWFNDYPGNNLYQTFGNVHGYSTVGLMFLDFESGDLLLLSGQAKIETTEKPSGHGKFLPRRFSFTLEKGARLKQAVYGRWTLQEMSPFLSDDLD